MHTSRLILSLPPSRSSQDPSKSITATRQLPVLTTAIAKPCPPLATTSSLFPPQLEPPKSSEILPLDCIQPPSLCRCSLFRDASSSSAQNPSMHPRLSPKHNPSIQKTASSQSFLTCTIQTRLHVVLIECRHSKSVLQQPQCQQHYSCRPSFCRWFLF